MTTKDIDSWTSVASELPKEHLYVEVCMDRYSEERCVACRVSRRFYNENKEELSIVPLFWRYIR